MPPHTSTQVGAPPVAGTPPVGRAPPVGGEPPVGGTPPRATGSMNEAPPVSPDIARPPTWSGLPALAIALACSVDGAHRIPKRAAESTRAAKTP
jgi:hypothetical protein